MDQLSVVNNCEGLLRKPRNGQYRSETIFFRNHTQPKGWKGNYAPKMHASETVETETEWLQTPTKTVPGLESAESQSMEAV